MAAPRVAAILATVLADASADDTWPDVLVTKCAAALPITGVGLAWMTDDGPAGTFAATDGPARVMETLQFELGEGPCVEASSTRSPVLQSDLARTGGSRWPAFTAGAVDAGIRAIFALPLQVGGIRLGVLDLYRDAAGPLDGADLTMALDYADAATALLLHTQTSADPEHLQQHVAEPMDHHAEVHQATGMLAARLSLPLAEALAVLRAAAYSAERPMLDVAKDVVERRIEVEA